MIRERKWHTAAFAALGVAMGFLLAAHAVQGASTSPWSRWTRIRMQARPLLLFFGQVDMNVRQEGSKKLFETQTKATFMGAALARSHTLTTIDSASGRTLEYYDLSSDRGRRYVFGETGYTVERLRAKNGPEAPVSQWEVTKTERFDYPTVEGRPAQVFDYYGMILHLRDSGLEKPGDARTVYVATSHGAFPYIIRVGEVRRNERTFQDLSTGARRTEMVREFRLRISPADPAHSEEGFLKMEGDTEIWVEAETRTLLEIEGKIPKIPSRVEISLSAIE